LEAGRATPWFAHVSFLICPPFIVRNTTPCMTLDGPAFGRAST
jgi:hypothetical protein